MTAYFPGLEHWCNITGSTSDARHDQYNRPMEIVLTIKAAAEQVLRAVRIAPDRSLDSTSR